MLGRIFLAVVFATVLCLGIAEVLRFLRARRGGDEAAYPRWRLIRRLASGSLMLAIVLAVQLKPEGWPPGRDLAWYGGCFVAAMISIWITLRDLHETSLSAVATQSDFRRDTEREILGAFEDSKARKKKQNPKRRGKRSNRRQR